MAILTLQGAVDARVATDVEPIEAAVNAHLTKQRTVDYISNPEIVNPNIRVNIDGVQLTVAAQEAVKTSVEAAGWKSVEVIQNAKGVIVAFSKDEKPEQPGGPGVYVATPETNPIELKVGEFGAVKVTVTKDGKPYTPGKQTFSSNKQSVVTVTSDGDIEAKGIGSAVVTVKEGELYSVTVNVIVTAA